MTYYRNYRVKTIESSDDGTYIDGTIRSHGVGSPMVMTGDARVLWDIWVPATGLRAPGTKPAIFVEHGISGAYQFTDGTDDTLVCNIKIPDVADTLNVVQPSISLGWSCNNTDPGDDSVQGVWQVEWLWTGLNNDTTGAADGTGSVTTSASTIANGLVVSTIQLDSKEATDICVHLRIKRLGDSANDTLAYDAELHGICVEFTTDKLGREYPT